MRTFVFYDIVLISERDLEIILRDVDNYVLAKALKDVEEEVIHKVFKSLRNNRKLLMKKIIGEMELVTTKDKEDAQLKIIEHIKTLREKENIAENVISIE